MLFIVRSHDYDDKMEVREKFTDLHKKFLSEMSDKILVPGTLYPEIGGKAQGSIWIVKADSFAEVESIYHQGPFWINGLRKKIEVNLWNKVFPESKVLI